MSNKSKLPKFGPKSIRLVVNTHIRHVETKYDTLLARGYDRREARAAAEVAVSRVLAQWERPA
jgi:hypothetical protein